MADTWTGAAGDGDYDNGANWSDGATPTATDSVTIDPGAVLSVSTTLGAAGDLTLGSLTRLGVAAGGTLAIGASGADSTIDNAGTIALGSVFQWGWYASILVLASATTTLSGGGVVALSGDGTYSTGLFNYLVGATPSDVLDNLDNTIEGSGFFGNGTLALDNAGTIAATGYYALELDTGTNTIENSGLLESAGPNALAILSGVVNTGTILAVSGNVTMSALVSGGTVASSGGELALTGQGTIDSAAVRLNGGSLVLAPGLLSNATLTAMSAGLSIQAGGMALDDTLWLSAGTLQLQGGGAVIGGALTLDNGSTASVLSGQGGTLEPASLSLDANSAIEIGAGATLHTRGAIANQGSIAVGAGASLLLDGATTLSGGGVLTLADAAATLVMGTGAGLVLDNAGDTIAGAGQLGAASLGLINGGTIDADGVNGLTLNTGAVAIANGGLLEATGAGGLVIDSTVTNTGTILADGGEVTFAAGAGLGNSVGGVLTGGSYEAAGPGTLAVTGAAVATDAAAISIAGAAATLTFGGVSLGASLRMIAAGGTLEVSDGALFGGAVALQNAGTIVLGGGTLHDASLLDRAGGVVQGAGAIAASLSVSALGTVRATGGTLQLGGVLSGAGTLSASGVLDVTGGGSFSGTIAGAGTVALDSLVTLLAGARLTAATVVVTRTVTLGVKESLATVAGQQIDFQAQANGLASVAGAVGDQFTNGGVLAATGPGSTRVSLTVVNTGTIAGDAGSLTMVDALTNNGTLITATARIVIDDLVTGNGQMLIGGSGGLTLEQGAVAGQSVTFTGSGGLLNVMNAPDFHAEIDGFAGADRIDVIGVLANGRSFANQTLTLTEKGATAATFGFAGNYATAQFLIGSDGHGGTLIRFT